MSEPSYQHVFQAMTPAGASTFGVRPAVDSIELGNALKRDDLLLTRAVRLPLKASPFSLPTKDEVALNEQLASLVGRGVPLVEALEVAASVVTVKSKPRIERLREQVASGASFADACEHIGGFDDVTIGVYRAAERSGDIAGAAKRLADNARRRQALFGKVITILIYPSVVAAFAFIIFFCLMAFIVPMFSEQMRGFLPPEALENMNVLSKVVFATGEWMNDNLLLSLGIVALAITLALTGRKILLGVLASLIRKVPAMGSLMLATEMARFFSVLAAMTRSGVTLADALASATNVLSEPRLREQLESLQRSLVQGGLWRTLIERVDALPLATRRLLVAAERGGELDGAFESLAEELADEVETRAQRLLAVLEPLILVLIFLVIGPIIIAVAIPMFTARTQVGG